jgi:uroporphyrinogen decarboxylase
MSNEHNAITDRESFNAYPFMDASKCDYSALDDCEPHKGQKLAVMGPNGVLENVIGLTGFDNLCLMIYDDEQLVYDIFERVGSGLVEYYKQSARRGNVGLCISNDDWGFKSQTMLSPADMRRFVFPWHKKIVEAIHGAGKYAALHSCGNYSMILDDLYALNYDARHSYEDNIERVEDAYDRFKGRLAVFGGLDLNFLITASEDVITRRARALVEKSMVCGGYALGSGNSIPNYVPDEKYFAMLSAAGKHII